MAEEKTIEKKSDDYAIYVGGKPFMNYVTAVVMQFTSQGAKKVVIKSRGKFISRAVDVAEVVKSRFMKNQVDVDNIEIDSEEFENKEGKKVRVSTLDITLVKT
jgi:DNA-binding protein